MKMDMNNGAAMQKTAVLSVRVAAVIAGFAVCCLNAVATDDPVMIAIQAELERTMSYLQLTNSPKPYFVSCSLEYTKSTHASAAFGALIDSGEERNAHVSVVVRVGDYKLDNFNFTAKQMWGGWSRLDWAIETPIDKDPAVIRRAIWWSIDRAYKAAVENLKRKRAVLENRSTPPVADDFAKVPAFSYSSDTTPQTLPQVEALENRVRQLSQFLVEDTLLKDSKVTASVGVTERWHMNSEGTKVHLIDNNASITAMATSQADDGVIVGDTLQWVARRCDQLPPVDEQKTAIKEMGKRVEAMRDAPLLDDFVGPVLFEAEAAAVLCARVLPDKFASRREPTAEGKEMDNWSSDSEKESLRRKIGRRVMATAFNVTDNPTLQTFDGVPLVGTCPADLEGVKPQIVELVKNGILKTLLTTRTPDRKLPTSNGHALSLNYDWFTGNSPKAGITSLIVTYENGMEESALRERLIHAIKEQDVEYGLLVRRMPQQSLRLGTDRSSSDDNDDSVIEEPLYVFCVYPDGKEKLARVVAFKGIGFREFKDVLTAGKKMYVYNNDSERGGINSIICPSILFEEGLVVKPERNVSKPPLLQSPMRSDDKANRSTSK